MSRACWGLVPSLVVILIALSLIPSGGAKAQQKKQSQEGRPRSQKGAEPTIRIGTQLVNVLFSVTDKQNRYVNDLAEEIRASYALAYYPENCDGKRHELRVKTSRPDVKIRASRTSYTAPTQ